MQSKITHPQSQIKILLCNDETQGSMTQCWAGRVMSSSFFGTVESIHPIEPEGDHFNSPLWCIFVMPVIFIRRVHGREIFRHINTPKYKVK